MQPQRPDYRRAARTTAETVVRVAVVGAAILVVFALVMFWHVIKMALPGL